ncbi:MAG: biotin--[acetyl-CoA-carboxylase] ligase [Candidatus Nitricoxidivorans perseverans]|uniref:biotin--[biotin carboxyl-carrier protein] ligase n=1 Tax=Candidatus Nitricoxidivorans perseverans TaxID=2975601 RepID=A0AA49FJZ6_9PROT|nr:MAG: biotin--[acetyl-CoA-carboxylase] ligase [Candidatus Nitricoxidivorans perseverans]
MAITPPTPDHAAIEVLDECDSTNARLLDRAKAGAPSGTVIVAGCQTAGRGRRGRLWFSAPGDSLTFSLLWRLSGSPAGLPLAVGVALSETFGGALLKWPNDLLLDGRKLGGVLVELSGNAAVIGIGINLRLPDGLPDDIRATAAALGGDASRDDLLTRLLVALYAALAEFGEGGFARLRARWLARCAHLGAMVRILSDAGPPLDGRCVGVDDDGALLLETADGVRRILSGDVSLRLA